MALAYGFPLSSVIVPVADVPDHPAATTTRFPAAVLDGKDAAIEVVVAGLKLEDPCRNAIARVTGAGAPLPRNATIWIPHPEASPLHVALYDPVDVVTLSSVISLPTLSRSEKLVLALTVPLLFTHHPKIRSVANVMFAEKLSKLAPLPTFCEAASSGAAVSMPWYS